MILNNTIKAGIVGVGFIGPVHLEALRRINVQVKGLAHSNAEKAAGKAVELGIEKAYESYEAMLEDPEIKVVHLAVPNKYHYSYAMKALKAGKHVVCEKPLAMNSEQSRELVELAGRTGLVTAVNFNLRFYPIIYQAREMVKNGEIGDIFILQGSYLQDWLLYPTDWNWRLEPELGGTLRTVGDIGSHWMDLITFITGLKIEEVFADFKTFHPVRRKPVNNKVSFAGKATENIEYEDKSITTEDYASILLHFENGARGVLTVSQISAGRKNRLFFEINGSKSSLVWNGERPNELVIGHRSEPNQVLLKDPSLFSVTARSVTSFPGGHNEGYPDTFKQLYERVYSYIHAGDFSAEPDFPTFKDGHYGMVLGEAIEFSARQRKWVKVNPR
jgi:predicted dehydrogenase